MISQKTCCESDVNDLIDKVSDDEVVKDNTGSERKELRAWSFW